MFLFANPILYGWLSISPGTTTCLSYLWLYGFWRRSVNTIFILFWRTSQHVSTTTSLFKNVNIRAKIKLHSCFWQTFPTEVERSRRLWTHHTMHLFSRKPIKCYWDASKLCGFGTGIATYETFSRARKTLSNNSNWPMKGYSTLN